MPDTPDRTDRDKTVRERKRLSKKEVMRIHEHLDLTYGHVCFKSGPDCKGPLEKHHFDLDVNNNALNNFRWACTRHNRQLNRVPKHSVRLSVRESQSDGVVVEGMVRPEDNLVAVSERMQRDLIEWLMQHLGPLGPHRYLTAKFVKKDASWDCHMSPVTVDRMVFNPGPLTAGNAPFRLIDVHLAGDRPGRKSTCVMWRGKKVEPTLHDPHPTPIT